MKIGMQQTATADTGSAADKACDLTRRAILDLTFPPGSTLSEAVLVAQIGASRTPIRQALQRLEHEGLVRVFPQRGTVVAPLDLQGFREALFTRIALEASAAAEAATKAEHADTAQLVDQIDAQRRAVGDGQDADFFRLNELFHRKIMAMAGVPNIWTVVQSVKVHLDRFRAAHLTLMGPYPLAPVVDEHAALADAIRRRHAVDAASLMQAHIRKVIPRAELLFERRPELFAWPPGLVGPVRLRAVRAD
jgi:DNA-binding GntR family transcriptional regulator